MKLAVVFLLVCVGYAVSQDYYDYGVTTVAPAAVCLTAGTSCAVNADCCSGVCNLVSAGVATCAARTISATSTTTTTAKPCGKGGKHHHGHGGGRGGRRRGG